MFDSDSPIPRLLVVEDDYHSLRLLEKILSNLEYEVTTAGDGVEALDILQTDDNFDLILSDWLMPRMDGVKLCQTVKSIENLRQIFFVILSSRDEAEDKILALDAGADEYLTKPCNPDELKARVRAGLRIRKLQSDISKLERNLGVVQLATTAGHEINNPLTGMFGYLDLVKEGLEKGEDPKVLADYVERLIGQTKRIGEVVQRLISLTDVQTKRYVGDQDMVDLNLD